MAISIFLKIEMVIFLKHILSDVLNAYFSDKIIEEINFF